MFSKPGLAAGFFAYFLVLVILVALSGGVFKVAWFLDGRRRNPGPDETTGPVPMMPRPPGQ